MFPLPPSDNLYKFMFMAGVILIVGSGYLGSEGEKMTIDRFDRLRQKAEGDGEKLADIDKLETLEKLSQKPRAEQRMIGNAFLMLVAGYMFVTIGGVTWILLVQQYQDRLLWMEYEKLDLELLKLKKELGMENVPPSYPKVKRDFKYTSHVGAASAVIGIAALCLGTIDWFFEPRNLRFFPVAIIGVGIVMTSLGGMIWWVRRVSKPTKQKPRPTIETGQNRIPA